MGYLLENLVTYNLLDDQMQKTCRPTRLEFKHELGDEPNDIDGDLARTRPPPKTTESDQNQNPKITELISTKLFFGN